MHQLLPLIILANTFFLQAAVAQNLVTFHSNEMHTGIYPDTHSGKLGGVSWSFKTDGKIFSSPAIVNNLAVVGSEDGNVYAIDTNNGKLKWKFKTNGPVHSSPAYYDGVFIFGSLDGNYYAVKADSGKETWRFKTGGEKWMGGKGYWGMKPDTLQMDDLWEFYLSSPVVKIDKKKNTGTVYFGSSDHYVYAVNVLDGSLKWKFRTNDLVHSTPALYNNLLYVGSWDASLYALDADTGNKIWEFKTGTNAGMTGIQSSPTVDNGMVYFGARDAHFYALDALTGEMKWKYNADNSWILNTAASKDKTLFFGTSDSYLMVAVDAFTGKEKWRTKLFGYVYSSPALSANRLYVGDFTGRLHALKIQDGTIQDEFATPSHTQNSKNILKEDGSMDFMKLAEGKDLAYYESSASVMRELYRLGSIVSSPVIANGMIYISSTDGYLYAIRLE